MRVADALGNRPGMNIAEIYMPAVMAMVCGLAAGEFRQGHSLLRLARVWGHALAALQDSRLLNIARKVRNRFSLMVDGGSDSLDSPMILGRFRPVKMVRKRGAIPHQSAPYTGRQSSHRLAVAKGYLIPSRWWNKKKPAWQSLRGFSLNQDVPLRPARQEPTRNLLNELAWVRSRMVGTVILRGAKKDLPIDQPFKLLGDLDVQLDDTLIGLALASILGSDRESAVFLRSVQNSKQLGLWDRSFSIRPL
jgi:hypothetical protein